MIFKKNEGILTQIYNITYYKNNTFKVRDLTTLGVLIFVGTNLTWVLILGEKTFQAIRTISSLARDKFTMSKLMERYGEFHSQQRKLLMFAQIKERIYS